MMKLLKTLLFAWLVISIFQACKDDDDIGSMPPLTLEDLLDSSIVYTINPNGIAPLTAIAQFKTLEECKTSIEVLGSEPVSQSFNVYQLDHSVPIIGLYPGVENTVVLTIETKIGQVVRDTQYLTTDPLPNDLPDIEINEIDRGNMEPGMNLSGLSLANGGKFRTVPIIFDNEGKIRWYLDLSFLGDAVFPIKRLKNGNLFFGIFEKLYEYDMLGTLVNEWYFPGYYVHHDFIELPDGNLVLAVDKLGTTIFNGSETVGSVEDHMIEIDRLNSTIIREWDLRKILDVDRNLVVDGSGGDWFHQNAIFYDETDNTLVISGRNQGIVKVTFDSEIVWIMAPHLGWGKAGENGDGSETAPFLLTAVDANGIPYTNDIQEGTGVASDFEWTWGQHAPMKLPNGNLFVFDNGVNRNFNNTGLYSRGVEYKIDEEAATVQQVWEYGEERGLEFFSFIISDVDYLSDTGNRLIMPGTVNFGGGHFAKITEVNYPTSQVVFEATLSLKDLGGTGQQGWGQIDIVYRSQRMELYPSAD